MLKGAFLSRMEAAADVLGSGAFKLGASPKGPKGNMWRAGPPRKLN